MSGREFQRKRRIQIGVAAGLLTTLAPIGVLAGFYSPLFWFLGLPPICVAGRVTSWNWTCPNCRTLFGKQFWGRVDCSPYRTSYR